MKNWFHLQRDILYSKRNSANSKRNFRFKIKPFHWITSWLYQIILSRPIQKLNQIDYNTLIDLKINLKTLPSEDLKWSETSNLSLLLKIRSLNSSRNKKRKTKEVESESKSKFYKFMKRRLWNNFQRKTQCLTRSSFISKESSRLWKLKLKPSTVSKERLLTLLRKMFNLKMNLKSLTRKREFKLYLKKEKRRRIKEVKQLE